ncbi:MAG: MobA/MobL family protein, partial [Eubacteriales bacterium]|nr:MobA/MobL family protein [Eubacteriales bacterium]
DRRMDRLPGILKEDGYPDVQVFKRLYDDATLLVEQYNRDLAAWERQVHGEQQPQQAPPEKESIRKKLRDMEAEAKRRNAERQQKPRHRSYNYDRGR